MSRTVALCSIGTGPHQELLDIARPSFEHWARRHGYDLDLRTSSPAPERPPSWGKVRVVAERLATHDVVIWVDADSVVVDPRHDLAALVDRRRPLALAAHEYQGQTVPNMGVFALRSTRFARRLVRELWSMEQYLHHKWWENAALLDLLGYDITAEPIRRTRSTRLHRRIMVLDVAWNSIDLHPSAAPIVKHYPGLSNAERRRRMLRDVTALDLTRLERS